MSNSTTEYLRSSMERHAAMFAHTGLKAIGGASPPRTSITENLVETFARVLMAIGPRTVLEIGAHEAAFSADIKRRLPKADVVAVEANPHVHEHYRSHPHIVRSGISYELCAISDQDGAVEFNIPTLVAGTKKPLTNMMGSLGRLTVPNSQHETITVRARTLDGLLSEHPNDPLAIWIDVEGMVDRVLAGGARSMERASVVICEVETAKVWAEQATATDIIDDFASHGFIPIARDCQKAFQYNVLFIKSDLLANEAIATAVQEYTAMATEQLAGLQP